MPQLSFFNPQIVLDCARRIQAFFNPNIGNFVKISTSLFLSVHNGIASVQRNQKLKLTFFYFLFEYYQVCIILERNQ